MFAHKSVLVAMCAIVLAASCFAAEPATRPPNIIHIVGDDIGYDDIGCFGAAKIKTPNIDKLAAEGMRFTSFYSPSPVCTPTRAALMTGCYAPRVGLPRVLFPNDNVGLADSEITIGQLLQKRGYATAVIGKWHLGHLPQFLPTRHGFDFYFGIPYPNDHGPERKSSNHQKAPFPPIPLMRGDRIVEQPARLDTLPDRFTDEAIKFITDNKGKPFFLHLANIETHTPWFVPERFAGKSQDGAYGDAVECHDAQVGRLMEALEKLNLADNTLVVWTSDNGPVVNNTRELTEIYGKYATVDLSRPHMLRGGKGSARFEGGVRVPAIMRWPGKIPAGTKCGEVAAGFDLFTTFARLAGATIPEDRIIDGRDISPLMFAAADAKSPHGSFYYYRGYDLQAVRRGTWKLVLASDKPGIDEKRMLFDLAGDVAEKHDLAPEHPEVVKELEQVAEEARQDLGDDRTGRAGTNRRPAARAD